jgi:CO/xanthine dehydrogenase Mo-binding subunit
MSAPVSFEPKLVGQSVKRVEDPLLLTGRAQCIDDLAFPGMLHTAFLRSPHAHARIRSIDVSQALAMPGVEHVLVGDEFRTHAQPLGQGWQGYAIALDKVRYVGEPLAAVAAISRHVAEDAAERIKVDYEILPAVVDARRAIDRSAPRLYEAQDTNVVHQHTYTYGDPENVLSHAEVVVRGAFRFPRISGNPLETAGCISRFDPVHGEITSWSNAQLAGWTKVGLSAALGVPANRVRVILQPHGGSFGTKMCTLKYLVIAAALSKLCGGRPVKYIEDRLEHLMASGTHALDRQYEAEFGFTRDGRCTAMRIRLLSDVGASCENGAPTMALKPLVCLTSAYRVQHVQYDLTAVVTNKCPEGAYRGYGPPPHTLVIERMMDKAAATLNLDPAEIRRRNFIQPDEFPYKTPTAVEYDSGNYPEVLRVALERSGYDALRQEQQRARDEGRVVGLGVAFGLEPGGFWGFSGPFRDWATGKTAAPEAATIHLDATGQLQVDLYHALEGQGQFTFAAQLVADSFGVPLEAVRVVTAEPQTPPPTTGPIGSRQAVTLTFAVLGAADRLREKLTKVAGRLLDATAEDLELRDGAIRVRAVPARSLPLGQIAATMIFRPDLLPPGVDGDPAATYSWHLDKPLDSDASPYLTYANACHVVLLEIDPDTGQVAIRKYVIADDCGTRLNPAIVEGQVQGSLAQAIGAALLEEYVYDDRGQPLVVTFMDYLIPTVFEVPMAEKFAVVTPSPFTPLGAKGSGEGAIHVAPAAIFCALNDALAPLGVELTYASATPERLWRLIRQARERGARVA